MTLDELPPTIDIRTTAALLGVSRNSAYEAARRGEIPTIRIGRRLIVPTAQLLELIGPKDPAARADGMTQIDPDSPSVPQMIGLRDAIADRSQLQAADE